MFTAAQQQQYEEQGFLILRSQFSEEELKRLDDILDQFPPLDDGKLVGTYPAPGRYTLAKSSWTDPAFVYFAEHPAIVNGAKALLDDDVHLTAYVMYDRTPGGPGIPPHHDYKRWRPVGSSVNWLFTIVPMCDYNEETGQLFVAPGSHRLDRMVDREEGAIHIEEAVFPKEEDFIDPKLKRGDLLFMNMHLWHKAAGNKSSVHRLGLFNKYAARHCPPATGYFLYTDHVYDLFSEEGKKLLAVHSNKLIQTTRLLLQREKAGENEFFFVDEGDALSLPGGPIHFEDAIPDWDIGNYIDALQDNVKRQIRLETPWVSYVGDYDEGDHLCRVYAYPMNQNGFPVPYHEGRWITESELSTQKFVYGYEQAVVTDWLDPTMIRGKGLSQAKSRIDQFAY
ncbi:MAG: phytanoyl-CoA dioxygenase family protein [Pseudomonadota bacterium]